MTVKIGGIARRRRERNDPERSDKRGAHFGFYAMAIPRSDVRKRAARRKREHGGGERDKCVLHNLLRLQCVGIGEITDLTARSSTVLSVL